MDGGRDRRKVGWVCGAERMEKGAGGQEDTPTDLRGLSSVRGAAG